MGMTMGADITRRFMKHISRHFSESDPKVILLVFRGDGPEASRDRRLIIGRWAAREGNSS